MPYLIFWWGHVFLDGLVAVDICQFLGIDEFSIYCNLHGLDFFVPVFLGMAVQVFKGTWMLWPMFLVTVAMPALKCTPGPVMLWLLQTCRGTALVVLDNIWKNSLEQEQRLLFFSLTFSQASEISLCVSELTGAGGGVSEALLWPPPLGLCWVRLEASTALGLPQGLW